MYTINCKGKIIDLTDPLVMGILNATPDSFYQGHLNRGTDEMVALAVKMIGEGADIIDIGGQSTRPGSERIGVEEELRRVIPLVEKLHLSEPGCILSIDTYNSRVALEAVDAGASIVNDISGGNLDDEMLYTVGVMKVPYVCMHMLGTPETMQQQPMYADVVATVLDFFIARIERCHQAGINDVIIDPGFGFGKTIGQNFRLLSSLKLLTVTGKPILAGLSRKSTVYKTLGVSAAEALNGTTVLNTMALMNGASLLRVHDVREAREAILLYQAYKKNAP
jgi:dihydropteroate synthase